MKAHDIHDVVVCPGSRNATIVHDLHEAAESFSLHPVTDERSAAFVALGVSLATQSPAAVCVTSGSALLACIPAVAEACYRNIPLLVISADRPPQWIGQLDGQTLQQVGALAPYCQTFSLQIPYDAESAWHNNRQINEALLTLRRRGGTPVHINVPIAEPMFSFRTPQLPSERVVREVRPVVSQVLPDEVVRQIAAARLPALIIGQYERGDLRKEIADLERHSQLWVLPEILSDVRGSFRMNVFDRISETEQKEYLPDVIVQIGGNFVHKRFKQILRRTDCRVIRVGEDCGLYDTFCHLTTWVSAPAQPVLAQLAAELPFHKGVKKASDEIDALCKTEKVALCSALSYTEVLTLQTSVGMLHRSLQHFQESYTLHLANSSAVRAAQCYFESGDAPVFCNRGVNGIEGSLSVAVGYALKMWGLCFVVIGDLSFFYDANALWNTRLPRNLRVLLLNNGHGGIFDHLPGLSVSPACDEFIAAGKQHFSAEGIAEAYHLGYYAAHTPAELRQALTDWQQTSERAQLIEVFLPA